MSAIGPKIIAGIKEAIAGNYAAVTIEGQRWIRADESLQTQVEELGEAIKRADAENARLRAALTEIETFPYVGVQASIKIVSIAKRALADG